MTDYSELTDEQRASAKRSMQEFHANMDRLKREHQEMLWESNRDPYMELLAEKEALQDTVITLTDSIEEYTLPISGECRLSFRLGDTVYSFSKHEPETNPFLESIRQLFLLAEKALGD